MYFFLEIWCIQVKIYPKTYIDPKYGALWLDDKISVLTSQNIPSKLHWAEIWFTWTVFQLPVLVQSKAIKEPICRTMQSSWGNNRYIYWSLKAAKSKTPAQRYSYPSGLSLKTMDNKFDPSPPPPQIDSWFQAVAVGTIYLGKL